ncbi:MAG TPA: HPF/RaiA family ribosome-associated protein [Gemmatimonadaceae bacterium]|nr:HPF/RaiA family ribosome-associated protein [Gemmatimonadaceae bacterium]
MDIIFQSHHATVSQFLRDRAARRVEKAAARLARAVDAVVCFEVDGPTRRVEIVLHQPRHRDVRAVGEGPRFTTALSAAMARLDAQTRDPKRPRRINPLKPAFSA